MRNGTYGVGDVVNVSIEFSDVVVVNGTPVLVLDLGNASYVSGNATTNLSFVYEVKSGDSSSDLDWVGLFFGVGNITDVDGNGTAVLTIPTGERGLAGLFDVVVDGSGSTTAGTGGGSSGSTSGGSSGSTSGGSSGSGGGGGGGGGGSSSGGGGGGSGSGGSTTTTGGSVSDGAILKVGELMEFNFSGVLDSVRVVASRDVSGVGVDVRDVSELPKYSAVADDERVYDLFEVDFNGFSYKDVDVVRFVFSVDRTWMDEQGLASGDVILRGLLKGSWVKLEIDSVSETDAEFVYSAVVTTDYDAYAVMGSADDGELAMDLDEVGRSFIWFLVGGCGVLAVGILAFFLVRRGGGKRKRREALGKVKRGSG